jgi:hypothetical protein
MFASLGSNCSVSYQLTKYNIKSIALPFDWCQININQLISVLENNFEDFSNFEILKESTKHNLIENNKIIAESSLILKNTYNIRFAHEILSKYSLDEFIFKMKERMKRFTELKEKIIFVRIELSPIKNDYINKIQKLLVLLDKYFINYELILIVPNILKFDNPKIICHKYDSFSSDWKMDHLPWKLYFDL